MKGAKSKAVFLLGLVIVCVGIIGAGAVQAADVSLGLGVGLSPDYEGSEDYAAVPLPYLNVVWPNQMSIDWLGNKAKFNLIPSSTWKGGLIGEYIPERDDVDSSAVDNLDDVVPRSC